MTALVVSSEGMTPKIDTDKLITVSTAAKLLKIGRMGVYKAIERGKLPTIEIDGVLFIRRSDLPQYRKNKSVGGRPKKQKS